MKVEAVIAAILLGAASTTPARAQFPIGGGTIVSDPPVEQATEDMDVIQLPAILADEDEELLPGLAGGFDASQALSGDLEQQVSSAGGMPLVIGNLQQYPQYWPGYHNASYVQNPPPGSPEANNNLVLGTLWGALNAGADQQQSQQVENQRLENLEGDAAAAIGNLQVQEVGNEIALFQAQQDIKLRNALNGNLNALLTVESNRMNQEARDNLESLTVAGANFDWDFSKNLNPPEPQLPE